jgi:hypothetical protein
MDLSVRDTWEITPDQVTLTGLDWGTSRVHRRRAV